MKLMKYQEDFKRRGILNNKKSKIYIKDNVFDNFDISDLLKKDLLIPKTNLENFIYKQYIHSSNSSSTSTDDISQIDKSPEEIISEINNSNNFNIDLEKLLLIYKNGYEVPFIDKYTPIKLIGQGHFGLVLSVIDNENNKKMAVKIIKKENFSDEFYLSESQLLNKLNHERIIKLYEVIDTADYLFIFTELCLGGSLKDYIISKYNSNSNYFMKDSEISAIIKNIMQGVEYLANNGIIHCDLKPENIMFRKENDINSLVLCDLGLAKENIGNSFIDKKCGTLLFMAPEVIMNRPYDSLVDIWSIGIIMYILESGGSHPLYKPSMRSSHFIELINSKTKINFPDFFPTVARNFFLKLCKCEPFFRYNVNKALNHPWIIRTNNKIPLNLIEDIEKENKIKNFKNMLIALICLKQLKHQYKFKQIMKSKKNIKKNNSLIYRYKLMTPILNLDKYHFNNYNNDISKDESKEGNKTNLPSILSPLSPKAKNIINTAKSLKSLNSLRKNIKPQKLFVHFEKKEKQNKIKSNLDIVREKSSTYRNKKFKKQKSVLNCDISYGQNSLNKINNNNNSVEKNMKIKKEKVKKFRLYSSNRINHENGFFRGRDYYSSKNVNVIYNNHEKIIKYFLH